MSRTIDRYVNMDYKFANTRECRFLVDLLKAMEDHDDKRFIFLCKSYIKMGPIEPWKEELLKVGEEHARGEDNFA